MMLKTILMTSALAATDCLDPLTISIQIYLLTTGRALLNSIALMSGISLATITGGIVLSLGPIREVDKLLEHPKAIYFVFQLLIAVAIIAGGFRYWQHFKKNEYSKRDPSTFTPAAAFMLGVAFTVVDLPTNVPLIAAADEMVRQNCCTHEIVAGSVSYGLVRISPLILILAAYSINKERSKRFIGRVKGPLFRWGHTITACIIVSFGLILAAGSVVFLTTGKELSLPIG